MVGKSVFPRRLREICLLANGFALAEILTALLVISILVIAFTPLMVFSLQTMNQTGEDTRRLWEDQGKMEADIAQGISYRGTTVPLEFDDPQTGDIDVTGGLVEFGDLSTFLASVPTMELNPSFLNQGYPPVTIEATGTNTHFDGASDLDILDRDGDDVRTSVSYSLVVQNETSAQITIQRGLTNAGGPYVVRIETGQEVVRAKLPVYMPSLLAAGDGGSVIITPDSPQSAWEQVDPGTEVNLNDVAWGDSGYHLIGEEGTLLALKEGTDWSNSSIGEILGINAIARGMDKWVAVGDGSGIFSSTDWENWVRRGNFGAPVYVADGPSHRPAVHFDGNDLMYTLQPPVTGDRSRTVYMVVTPEENSGSLISWGDTGAGELWAMNLIGLEPTLDYGGAGFFSGLPADAGAVNIIGINYKKGGSVNEPNTTVSVWKANELEPQRSSPPGDLQFDTGDRYPAYLGGSFSGYLPFTGQISEIIVYDKSLPENKRDDLENYLSDKYFGNGNAGIPSGLNGHLKIWLKADTISGVADGESVSLWRDSSGNENHAMTRSFNDVTFAGNDETGMFVAVGDYGSVINSMDGEEWTDLELAQNAVLNLNGISSYTVPETVSLFITVGENGAMYMSAYSWESGTWPGGSWEALESGTTSDLNAVSIFKKEESDCLDVVAVGENGTVVTGTLTPVENPPYYTWETEDSPTVPTENDLNDVLRLSGELVAVGAGGTIITSPTGNLWILQLREDDSPWVAANLNGIAALGD